MKRGILKVAITAAVFMSASQPGSASDVSIPNTFTAGTPAVAAEVNDNFSAVESAINDNFSRIVTLQSNPSLTGNLTLVPSTATTGNIMKGTTRFLHNYGQYNTFLGELAGNFTMTGTGNTANGSSSLSSNTTGDSNTANGVWALISNTDGATNTASGAYALSGNTHGSYNSAYGAGALGYNTNGNYNTAIGRRAIYSNDSGNENTAIGHSALYNSTGNGNIAIGNNAGNNLTTGNNNIDIGNNGIGGESGTIRIGNNFEHTRAFIAGIRSQTTGITDAIPVVIDSNGQLGTVSSSRRVKDHIRDMGDTGMLLMQLRPVTFYYKSDRNPHGRTLQYGLIAEEVDKVAPQLVAHARDGKIETVYYQHLTPMLLNEYQHQQHTLKAQQALLKQQAEQLQQQARELSALKGQMARMATLLSQQQPARQIVAAQQR